MKVYLTRRFQFEAAHRLSGLREGHKCARLHGHNYELHVTLSWDDSKMVNGMVKDAEEIDDNVERVIRRVDHHPLHELGERPEFKELAQPTAENLAIYFWRALQLLGNSGKCSLEAVRVYENDRLWADVKRESDAPSIPSCSACGYAMAAHMAGGCP